MIGVIDGTLMLYRFRYIAEKDGNISPQFISFLFFRNLFLTLSKQNYSQVYVLWDDGRPQHRSESGVDYKGDREKDESPAKEAQLIARNIIRRILPYFGIVSVGHEEAEADDLAYLIVNMLKHQKGMLISEDSDWKQCLVNRDWAVYRPIKDSIYTRQDFEEEWAAVNPNIDPIELFRYYNALLGTHNNIPKAVPNGIGPVKCIPILKAIFEGKKLPHISDKIETGVDGELIDPQVETRKKIDRNYKLVSMWWILADSKKFLEKIDDATEHTQKSFRSPSKDFWFLICNQLKSSTLKDYYDKYQGVASKFIIRKISL